MTGCDNASSKAWERFGYKFSPSKKVFLSPIRHCDHLIGYHDIVEENFIKAHIWILLNTEEFFYQNSGLLVYHSFKDIKSLRQMLRDKWNIIKWNDRLQNYKLINMGGFGKVFVVTDTLTNIKYALKQINPPIKDSLERFSGFASSLLQERNLFLELNQSPFFVRIFAAFQNLENSTFSFILDFCLCDLKKITWSYPFLNHFNMISEDYLNGQAWEKVSEILTPYWKTKYDELTFIYLFEMLCALHYLATRHIVHSDIKPENFLIAKNCHLKLTDFGLSFKNDWFYRNSITKLPGTIEAVESGNLADKSKKNRGTIIYYDPEQQIEDMLSMFPDMIDILTERLIGSKYSILEIENHPSFLSDLYAVGLITLELITGGLQLAEYSLMPEISDELWSIEVIYNDNLREMIFERPLDRLPSDRATTAVFQFLITIFTPRIIRAMDYTSLTTLFKQSSRETVPYIDINKIEDMMYYKSRSITKESVQNIIFPDAFQSTLVNLSKSNLKDSPSKNNQKTLNLHPFEFISRDF